MTETVGKKKCNHPKSKIQKTVMAAEVVWTCKCGVEITRRARRLMD